jgi:hypothetical protein
MKTPIPAVSLEHNLEPDKFKWLWMKYVTAINDRNHCTNCLRGPYGKILSKHNAELSSSPVIALDELREDSFKAIYICGVIKKGYPRTNYEHNLHAVIQPKLGRSDSFEFENWQLSVTNGFFQPIPSEAELPEKYRSLPPEFTTCRIFRWAVCSDLNNSDQQLEIQPLIENRLEPSKKRRNDG